MNEIQLHSMKIDGGTHKIQLFIKSMGPNKDVLLKEDEAENNSHEQLFIKEFLILYRGKILAIAIA